MAADEQVLFVGDAIAIASTDYGKVRGFILRGIHQFLGIPYGADTSGKNRFMPPQNPRPGPMSGPPLFDGRMRAFHCDDIYFWFYNTDLMLTTRVAANGPARCRKRWPNLF